MQQRKTNGSHNWFCNNSQNVSVFKHISVQHLLPCSILKCSQDTKFFVPLPMSFLQSQNNLAMDKVVDKTGLMLGNVRSSLGGSVSAAPLTIRTVTVCPPEQSSATPHQGTAALRVSLPRTATAKLTAQVSQLLHSQHLHSRGRCPNYTAEAHVC